MRFINPLTKLTRAFEFLFVSGGGQSEDLVESRFQRLRRWRNELARTRGVRPFRILSNQSLREVAARLPTEPTALIQIKGIGPKKLEAFGEPLLELTRELISGENRAGS